MNSRSSIASVRETALGSRIASVVAPRITAVRVDLLSTNLIGA